MDVSLVKGKTLTLQQEIQRLIYTFEVETECKVDNIEIVKKQTQEGVVKSLELTIRII